MNHNLQRFAGSLNGHRGTVTSIGPLQTEPTLPPSFDRASVTRPRALPMWAWSTDPA